jgi:hypothetical protein
MQQVAEGKLAGETKVTKENLTYSHFVYHDSRMT